MKKPDRPDKIKYYVGIAKAVAQRSTCFRARAGAIIVRDDQIIATGYVGAPRGTKDCLERGNCLREELNIPHGERYELCRSVHSEQNAIINAARAGVNLLNGNMYIYGERPETGELMDFVPCYFCKRMIINTGLNKIYSQMHDGSIKEFIVTEWVKDWQDNDIIDDKYKYGDDLNKKLGLK
jgi:dCMP deaminase